MFVYMFVCVCKSIRQKGIEETQKQSIYSYVEYYGKDCELHEIYFPVRLAGFKGGKRPKCKFISISLKIKTELLGIK